MTTPSMPSSLRREKRLTLLNLVVVSWLFGMNGFQVLHKYAMQLIFATGLTPTSDVAAVIVLLAIAPLTLPIGWIGALLHVNTSGWIVSWLFLISNAGLWAMFVAFFWRLIETGDFQTARDACFFCRRRRRRRPVQPATPNFEQSPTGSEP